MEDFSTVAQRISELKGKRNHLESGIKSWKGRKYQGIFKEKKVRRSSTPYVIPEGVGDDDEYGTETLFEVIMTGLVKVFLYLGLQGPSLNNNSSVHICHSKAAEDKTNYP